LVFHSLTIRTQSLALPHFQMSYSQHLILGTVSSTEGYTLSKDFFFMFYFFHVFSQLSVSYHSHFLQEICFCGEFQEVDYNMEQHHVNKNN